MPLDAYTYKAICDRLDISRPTLYRYIKLGVVPEGDIIVHDEGSKMYTEQRANKVMSLLRANVKK